VTFHERVANIERVLAEEKEALLVQLSNKGNELQSEKKHKELLVKKVGELKGEINSTSKEKANHEQAMSQLRDETTTQLRAKDQEIEWLKTTLRQREEQYRHDISAPSNHINRVQPTTPSSHNRAASNSVSYRLVESDFIEIRSPIN
jgi:chromosome segregation ATPase